MKSTTERFASLATDMVTTVTMGVAGRGNGYVVIATTLLTGTSHTDANITTEKTR